MKGLAAGAGIERAMAMALRHWVIRLVPAWLHPGLRSLQLHAFHGAWTMLRRLPGTSRRIGPPRGVAPTLADYASERRVSGVTYRELHPQEAVSRSLPRTPGRAVNGEFLREMHRVLPPAGIAAIANGRVLTRTGAVIAPDDQFIGNVSSTFQSDKATTHPAMVTARLPPICRVDGAVAVLTTFCSGTYYHWLFDTLPRLHLLRESGLAFDRVVAPLNEAFQRESLERLGLDVRQAITAPDGHMEAATLLVPTLPGLPGNPPRWACDFLRSALPQHAMQTRHLARRIYVSRARIGTRTLVGESEVVDRLSRHGFERVFLEELSFAEQVELFASAEIVVGPHGSGLANLVFSRKGTYVVELFGAHYVNVVYWSLANQLGLNYFYLEDERGPVPSPRRGRRVHENIALDPDRLEAVIVAIEGELGRERAAAAPDRAARA